MYSVQCHVPGKWYVGRKLRWHPISGDVLPNKEIKSNTKVLRHVKKKLHYKQEVINRHTMMYGKQHEI